MKLHEELQSRSQEPIGKLDILISNAGLLDCKGIKK